MRKGQMAQLELLQVDAPEGDGVPANWQALLERARKARRRPRQLKLDLDAKQLALFVD